MVRWLTLLLSLLCIEADAQQALYSKKITLSERNFVDSIGVEWERSQVYLPVTIGDKTYRFLLDTGAAQSVVYADTPIEGSRPAGFIRSHDANGAIDTVPMVILPPFTLGHLTVSGCQATIQRRPVRTPGVDGIIGFNLINSGLLAKIDTRNRRLILTDRRRHFSSELGFEARYRLRRHVPFVALTPFGVYNDEARFDTGDRSLYALSRQSFEAAIAAIPGEIEPQVEARTHGSQRISHFGTETTDEVAALCLRALKWGDFSFRNVRTLTAQGPSAIGSALLDYGAVIINPRRRRLLFQPYDGGGTQCWVDNRLPDIYYIPDRQGRPTVGLVWEQSEPYRQGFRQGDVITAVDGTPIRSVADFTHFPFIANQTYTVTVSDKHGNTRQIRLDK